MAAFQILVAAPRLYAGPVDDRLATIQRLEGQRAALLVEKASVKQRVDAKSAEITRLKAQRASWNRDRRLNDLQADARQLADRLPQYDVQVARLDGRLRGERQALLRDIDGELAQLPPPAEERRASLTAIRTQVARTLQPPRRKIVMPDARIDPLDGPEDLDEQALDLAESEQQLAGEEDSLTKRVNRYERMAELRRQRERSEEAGGDFDDEGSRRSAARTGSRTTSDQPGAGVPGADDETGGAFGEGDGPTDGLHGGGEETAMVLEDVVDSGTADELRRADRSSDPGVKARAAQRALAQVRARREQLKKSREQMVERARQLREHEHK